MLLFGLAIVVVLGTGGTRFEYIGLSVEHVRNPVLGFAVFAAIRLLIASRHRGIEGKLLRLFARIGLPPRDVRATLFSATKVGAILGLGCGVVIAIADVVHAAFAAGQPGLLPTQWVAAAGLALTSAIPIGVGVGGLLGALTFFIARGMAKENQPGRYYVGRATMAMLWIVSALSMRVPTLAHSYDSRPVVLLTVALSALIVSFAVFIVVPAAYLRARRGRWGLAVTAGAGLAMLLVLVAIATFGPSSGHGPGVDSTHPNVLVITVPGLRVDSIGTYRVESRLTPNVDAIALSGSQFLQTSTPSLEPIASIGSILTGVYPALHGIHSFEPDERLPAVTITQVLAAHGYHTAAFVSWSEMRGRETGVSEFFNHYEDHVRLRDRLVTVRAWYRFIEPDPIDVRGSESTVAAFRRWRRSLPPGPWFAWVQLGDALRPDPLALDPLSAEQTDAVARGVAPPSVVDWDAPPLFPPAWATAAQSEATVASWLRAYAASVAEVDAAVGRLRREIETEAMSHRTMFVLTTERGTRLGESGGWFEMGDTLDVSVTHTPWVISGPGVLPGRFVPGPSSLVDLTPTVLGLLDLEAPSAPWQGEDLSRYLQTSTGPVRDTRSGPVFTESPPLASFGERRSICVHFGVYRLLREPDGEDRLFFVADGELQELANPRGRLARQRDELADLLNDYLADASRYGQLR